MGCVLGLILRQEGRLEESFRHFKQAAVLERNNLEYVKQLGRSWCAALVYHVQFSSVRVPDVWSGSFQLPARTLQTSPGVLRGGRKGSARRLGSYGSNLHA
jgi:hypothetical protein